MADEKTSVSSYQAGIDAEKQKMGAYSKKFGTTVKSLQAGFKQHAKDMKKAAEKMREEGIRNMNRKVHKFEGDIKDQIVENKEAVAKIENSVKFFKSEINKKNRDFQAYTKGPFINSINAFHNKVGKQKGEFKAYAKGPFQDYIKAFWG